MTASDDETARVWETSSGREVMVLKGHRGPVRSASYSEDGRQILTTGFDRKARIWDAQSGEELLVIAIQGLT
jgi:WD40 repeat protein